MGRYRLILLITVILAMGVMATSYISYRVSRASIHDAIVESMLPLTSDNIYSEIQKDLIRPVFISSMMASDTFLRDWVLEGEQNHDRISRYLWEVQNRYGAFVSFFVSDRSRNYYYNRGLLKQVSPDVEDDAWYYRARGMQAPYEINVDRNTSHADGLIIFINYKVLDYDGSYLGLVGVGLAVDSVQKLVSHYQHKFKRDVYFIDAEGLVRLSGSRYHATGSRIQDKPGLEQVFRQARQQGAPASFEYDRQDSRQLINIRFIPELNWYLCVEQNESEATRDFRHALHANLLLCLVVTAIVVALVHVVLRRYQGKLETMATTDTLTGLPNRRAFDIVIDIFRNENDRARSNLAFITLDIDHFKAINDRLGHFGGDHVLVETARILKSSTRAADFICRWGGEEFLLVVKDCDEHNAMLLAEKMRSAIEHEAIGYKGAQIRITASLGVAVARAGDKVEAMLERADQALYEAKRAGRNRAVLGAVDR